MDSGPVNFSDRDVVVRVAGVESTSRKCVTDLQSAGDTIPPSPGWVWMAGATSFVYVHCVIMARASNQTQHELGPARCQEENPRFLFRVTSPSAHLLMSVGAGRGSLGLRHSTGASTLNVLPLLRISPGGTATCVHDAGHLFEEGFHPLLHALFHIRTD